MLVEPIELKRVLKKPCSRAKDFLIFKWIFVGFLLALMYRSVLSTSTHGSNHHYSKNCDRSVLLATLVSVEYEKQINTVEDLLETEKPVMTAGKTIVSRLLMSDPRDSTLMKFSIFTMKFH